MTYHRTEACSAYIQWAKRCATARFNLASSGVESLPLSELPVKLSDLEISAPGSYGYPPLQERLARRYDVSLECVVSAIGTSMANYLAMSAVLEPGDEVVIEEPGYDPLLEISRYLGAKARRLLRNPGNGFQIRLEDVARVVTKKSRLIVLTNLHNPSGALLEVETLRQIGEIARSNGAKVLVDEVYLEMLFDGSVRTAFHLGEHFLVTSSLTKAYGLSGLRCGWVLAAPELVKRMWRQNDLFGNIHAHIAEQLSVCALDHLENISARSKSLLARNWKTLDNFLAKHPELDTVRPRGGTIIFPRVPGKDGDTFCRHLREKYQTSVVPGSFFQTPDRIRIGIGGESSEVEEGLSRVGQALGDLRG
jgi:aspartate/methionine/tyrosine aminotransferase